MVCKEKWWFGSSLWRVDWIRPQFKYWDTNTHNELNDRVLLPPAWKHAEKHGRPVPLAEDIEATIGCYIYGEVGDKRMVFHAGQGDSLFMGEAQQRWKEQGKNVIGGGS